MLLVRRDYVSFLGAEAEDHSELEDRARPQSQGQASERNRRNSQQGYGQADADVGTDQVQDSGSFSPANFTGS